MIDNILVRTIVEGIQERKGKGIVIVDLTKFDSAGCSYFVICEGDSNTHVLPETSPKTVSPPRCLPEGETQYTAVWRDTKSKPPLRHSSGFHCKRCKDSEKRDVSNVGAKEPSCIG